MTGTDEGGDLDDAEFETLKEYFDFESLVHRMEQEGSSDEDAPRPETPGPAGGIPPVGGSRAPAGGGIPPAGIAPAGGYGIAAEDDDYDEDDSDDPGDPAAPAAPPAAGAADADAAKAKRRRARALAQIRELYRDLFEYRGLRIRPLYRDRRGTHVLRLSDMDQRLAQYHDVGKFTFDYALPTEKEVLAHLKQRANEGGPRSEDPEAEVWRWADTGRRFLEELEATAARVAEGSRRAREQSAAAARRRAELEGEERYEGDEAEVFFSGEAPDEGEVLEMATGVERVGAETPGEAWFAERGRAEAEARWRRAVEARRFAAAGGDAGGEPAADAGGVDADVFEAVAVQRWEAEVLLGPRRRAAGGGGGGGRPGARLPAPEVGAGALPAPVAPEGARPAPASMIRVLEADEPGLRRELAGGAGGPVPADRLGLDGASLAALGVAHRGGGETWERGVALTEDALGEVDTSLPEALSDAGTVWFAPEAGAGASPRSRDALAQAMERAPAVVVPEPGPVVYEVWRRPGAPPPPLDPVTRDLAPFAAFSGDDGYGDPLAKQVAGTLVHAAIAHLATTQLAFSRPDKVFAPDRFHRPGHALTASAGFPEPDKPDAPDEKGRVAGSLSLYSPYGPSSRRSCRCPVAMSVEEVLRRERKRGLLGDEEGERESARLFFGRPGVETVFQVFDRERGMVHAIEPSRPVAGLPSRALFAVNTVVRPVRSSYVDKLPGPESVDPVRPPAAFRRRGDLYAGRKGHVLLAEYLEERPPLLLEDGMSARLKTLYQKESRDDQGAARLAEQSADPAARAKRWKVGDVVPVEPGEGLPLNYQVPGAQLRGGDRLLTLETNLFLALAHAHECGGDFLLARHPWGQLYLREVTGAVLVGQELPREPVPSPLSPEHDELMTRLVQLHVWTLLKVKDEERRSQARGGGIQEVELPLREVEAGLNDRLPRDKAREIVCNACRACGLLLRDDSGRAVEAGSRATRVVLTREKRAPEDAELHRQFPPELFARWSCGMAGVKWLESLGVRGETPLQYYQPKELEVMRHAVLALFPREDEREKAGRAVDLLKSVLLATPWSTTQTYISARQDPGAVDLAFPGGEPTGTGAGYAFVPPERPIKTGRRGTLTKQGQGIAGTEADYRSMSNIQLRAALTRERALIENHSNQSLDEVLKLDRWGMVQFLKLINNHKFEGGDISKAAHFRGAMMNLKQRRQANETAAGKIFEKQRRQLSEAPPMTDAELEEEDRASLGSQSALTARSGGSRLTRPPGRPATRPAQSGLASGSQARGASRPKPRAVRFQESDSDRRAREAEEDIEGLRAMEAEGLLRGGDTALQEAKEQRDAAETRAQYRLRRVIRVNIGVSDGAARGGPATAPAPSAPPSPHAVGPPISPHRAFSTRWRRSSPTRSRSRRSRPSGRTGGSRTRGRGCSGSPSGRGTARGRGGSTRWRTRGGRGGRRRRTPRGGSRTRAPRAPSSGRGVAAGAAGAAGAGAGAGPGARTRTSPSCRAARTRRKTTRTSSWTARATRTSTTSTATKTRGSSSKRPPPGSSPASSSRSPSARCAPRPGTPASRARRATRSTRRSRASSSASTSTPTWRPSQRSCTASRRPRSSRA